MTHCVSAFFTRRASGPDVIPNLVVAKHTRLEIYDVRSEALLAARTIVWLCRFTTLQLPLVELKLSPLCPVPCSSCKPLRKHRPCYLCCSHSLQAC